MTGARRFACTLCGQCCNRSPEVELSEAAALAEVFVFRLLFRLYSLPRSPERGSVGGPELFYQKKRLLAAHSARKSPVKLMRGGRAVDGTHYLMISALALDTSPGRCVALDDGRCSIHARRPLACRTVPFHYARPDALAEPDFDAFVATPGYRCDTGDSAPLVLNDGRIVDAPTLQSRDDALALAERDRPWKEAIVRAMKAGRSDDLPSVRDVEANAGFAALTTSMRVGWEIARDAGMVDAATCRGLVEQQLGTIERTLRNIGKASTPDGQTLDEMRSEYQAALRQPAGAY